jgi:hypothetical protein
MCRSRGVFGKTTVWGQNNFSDKIVLSLQLHLIEECLAKRLLMVSEKGEMSIISLFFLFFFTLLIFFYAETATHLFSFFFPLPTPPLPLHPFPLGLKCAQAYSIGSCFFK